MKNQFFLAAVFLYNVQAFSCDVCGCSLGAFSQGLIPDYTSHFFGLRYNQANFNAEIDHGTTMSAEFSEDRYHRFEMVGRYNAAEKLKVSFFIPYVVNQMNGSEQAVVRSGIGDPTLLLNYRFLKNKMKDSRHYLSAGTGVKFPLGKSNLTDNGELLNRNFQPGSGSFDFLVTASYYFRKEKIGYVMETAYKINTAAKSGYRFGNQFNFSANLNYRLEQKKINWLVYGGLYFEQASRHFDNESVVFNTGGYGMYINAGLQLYFSRIRLSAGIQQPFYQHFYTDNITTLNSKMRMNTDLIIFIGKKKK